MVLLTANLYLDEPLDSEEDSEMRALRMELMMVSFQLLVAAWSYAEAVVRAESQASLQICLRRFGGMGWKSVNPCV